MFFLVALCLFVLIGCIMFLKEDWNNIQTKTKAITIAVAIAALIGFGASFGVYIADETSSSSKTKYSDLNDVEKANAKWAYEAQQAAKDYKSKYN